MVIELEQLYDSYNGKTLFCSYFSNLTSSFIPHIYFLSYSKRRMGKAASK